jgi:hypothetical protein
VYDRRTVELLLPSVWDEDYAYGVKQPTAPDPDMPKSKSAKNKANTLYAMLADIRQAWRRAVIPLVERQAMFMRFGLDWDQKDIGAVQSITQRGAGLRIERGVGRMTAWLNREEYVDGYDPSGEREVVA